MQETDQLQRRPWWFWGAVLVVWGCVAFANGISGQFIFDDEGQIVQNDAIHTLHIEMLVPSPRSLVNLSFAVNYALGGLDPRGYHLVNIVIHLAAACTLMAIIRRTLQLPKLQPSFGTNVDFLAFAVAAIWMVHPLQTQSVTYVVQRHESAMGLFFLMTLYCFIRATSIPANSNQGTGPTLGALGWYLSALASFLLAVGSKEVAIAVPVVVLLYDRMFVAQTWGEVLRKRWMFYAACLPILGWLWVCVSGAFITSKQDDATVGLGIVYMTPWTYLRSQPAVLLHYLRLVFWPDVLCLDYLWSIETNPWRIYGLGAIILTLLGLSFWWYARGNPLGFLGLTFFFILAPTSSIVPIADLAFEHRMYLPLAPVVAGAILGLYVLLKRCVDSTNAQRLLWVVCLVVGVLLTARTIARNADYRDPLIVWAKVLEVNPNNVSAKFNSALTLARSMDPENLKRARKLLDEVIAFAPKYAQGYGLSAHVHGLRGEFPKAYADYTRAAELDPQDVRYLLRHGRLLASRHQLESAKKLFTRATEIAPRDASAWSNLGTLNALQGDYSLAVSRFQQTLQLNPNDRVSQLNLAMALARCGDFTAAIPRLQALQHQQSTSLAAMTTLAWSLAVAPQLELRDGSQALTLANKAVSATDRKDPLSLEALAAALAETGQMADALTEGREAKRLAEQSLSAADNLRLQSSIECYAKQLPYRHSPSVEAGSLAK